MNGLTFWHYFLVAVAILVVVIWDIVGRGKGP